MATGILMPGAVVTNPIDIIPPAITSLSAWIYWGTDLAHSPNAGSLGNPIAGMGSVTFSPHYVSCRGFVGSLALPPFTMSATQTWMGAVRYIGGGTGGASGSLLSPPSGSSGPIISITSASIGLTANGITAPTNLAIASSGGNNWKFYAMTAQAAGVHMMYNLTDATQQQIVATGTLSVTANTSFGIGGIPSGAGSNDRNTDHAFTAWAMSLLTKPQIDAQYAAVKNTLAQFGIVV
jgi:hypothetical protein